MIQSDLNLTTPSSVHEAIKIHQNDPFYDAYNQKGKDTAIPTQTFQPCVYGMAASCLACTASVQVQELP
jgi:hypothetical protein